MRAAGVNRIAFSSTGSVYGEPEVFPTPEDAPFPLQTSLYAASKLAGEGLIGAYCHGYGFTGVVYRFVSILGERYTHGHVYDFFAKLQAIRTAPRARRRQAGEVLPVRAGLRFGDPDRPARSDGDEPGLSIYNLGTDETVIVDQSIAIITRELGLSPTIEYAGGKRGWAGDSPLIHLDCSRIRALGWAPTLTIEQGDRAHAQLARGEPERFGPRVSV